MAIHMVPEEQSPKLSRATLVALTLSMIATTLAAAPAARAQGQPEPLPDDASRPDPPQNGQPDAVPGATPEDPPNEPPRGTPTQPDARPWAQGVSEDDQTRANELFEAGDALLREFQLTAALDKYEAALKHWRHPAIHYRVASILISQGQQVRAYDQAERALRYGEAPLGKQFFDNATRIKEQLDSTLVWLTVRCAEDGAEVRLDGELLFQGPGEDERILMPGPHTVVATKAGMIPGTENVTLKEGTRTTLELTLRVEGVNKERFYPTKGRFGGTVRGVFDPQGINLSEGAGMALMVGADYGVMDNIDIEVGAILSGNPGLYGSAIFFLRKGLWRPTVFLAISTLWAGSVQPGARAGLGIEYTPNRWLAFTGQVGLEYYPRATERFVTTLIAPTIGIKFRR